MGYIFSISTPSPLGHSPYIPLRKHRGRGGLTLLLPLQVFLIPLLVQKKRFNLSPARSTTGYYKTAKKKDLYPTSFLKLVLPSSPAFCNAKYRGELRSVATRRGIKKTCNGSNRVNPLSPVFCTAKYRGGVQRTEGLIKKVHG